MRWLRRLIRREVAAAARQAALSLRVTGDDFLAPALDRLAKALELES